MHFNNIYLTRLCFRAVLVKTIGTMCIDTCVIFTGLIMYTHYRGCDPITANVREKKNHQLKKFHSTIMSMRDILNILKFLKKKKKNDLVC